MEGDEATIEQVTKQLNKLIEVIRVSELEEEDIVARELALIKVRSTPATRSEIMQLVDIFRASIVDVGPNSLIIEITGEEDKINALYNLLRPFGIRELMRTGRIAIVRGDRTGQGREEQAVNRRRQRKRQQLETQGPSAPWSTRILKRGISIMPKVYYDKDANLDILEGKTVGITSATEARDIAMP